VARASPRADAISSIDPIRVSVNIPEALFLRYAIG